MSPLALKSRTRIIKEVDRFLQSKELSDLSDADLEYLSKSLLADKLKEELSTEIKKLKIDICALKKKWLSLFTSYYTRRSYSHDLDVFLNWLSKRDERNSVITLKAGDVDDYIAFLKNTGVSDNTLRRRIASVSSFLSYLQRIDVIDKNYFKGARGIPRKKLETKSADDIPTCEEIATMEKVLLADMTLNKGSGYKGKVKVSRMGIIVIGIIKSTGLRVGALKTLEIDRDGNYKAVSKGNIVKGHVDEPTRALIKLYDFDKKFPLAGYNTESIKLWFLRFNKRLVKERLIPTVYSLHDVRHYAAIKVWKESKDIYKLKSFLNHASIATTQIYLSSLNQEV